MPSQYHLQHKSLSTVISIHRFVLWRRWTELSSQETMWVWKQVPPAVCDTGKWDWCL